jgi:hypothetical protein
MAMTPAGPGIKNDRAGVVQRQFTRPEPARSENTREQDSHTRDDGHIRPKHVIVR